MNGTTVLHDVSDNDEVAVAKENRNRRRESSGSEQVMQLFGQVQQEEVLILKIR
jgi:hypothetical protein